MPSKEEMQVSNKIQEDLIRRIEERVMSDIQPKGPPDIWKPESYEYNKQRDVSRKQFQNDILNDWTKIKKKDPNEIFRKQTTKDIAEIKDAIRKIGIMFDEDTPSEKVMKNHKMLRDAYNKYKMIEALILGQDK